MHMNETWCMQLKIVTKKLCGVFDAAVDQFLLFWLFLVLVEHVHSVQDVFPSPILPLPDVVGSTLVMLLV